MNNITVYGLDIAKNVFHTCVMNERGKVLKRKKLRRNEVLIFFANATEGVVGIESCGGSSFWAREISKYGHEVKLIPAQYVKPYVKSQKNDSIDAEAIAEAVLRPTMRYVSANSVEQQDLQNIHRVRARLVRQKVALVNQIRGLLLEYGIAIPQGVVKLRKALADLVNHPEHVGRQMWKEGFLDLYDELLQIIDKIEEYTKRLKLISGNNKVCRELEKIPGIGPLAATAIVSAVNNPSDFKNGRQFSAWLGLVPKQHSTGGKQKLLGITKRGDKYIRYLLVHGGRVMVRFANKNQDQWLLGVKERRGYNRAAVAYANKNARRIWRTLKQAQMAA